MKWNRMEISIDFDKFWENYQLILINSTAEDKKVFDAADFQTWLIMSSDKISCPVLSIVFYRYDNYSYVWGLVRRVDRQKLQELVNVKGIERFVITPVNSQSSLEMYIDSEKIQKRLLMHLFMNYVEKDALWSNLSGKCLVRVTSNTKKNNLVFLEFKLDKNLFLSINVRTYTLSSLIKDEKKLELPPYIIDEERDFRFRRAFKEFDDLSKDKTYRLSAIPKHKNSVKFLSFNGESNHSCKLKFLHQLLCRLKKSEFSKLGILDFKFEDINGEILSNLGSNDTFRLNTGNIKEFQILLDDECDDADKYFDECTDASSIKYTLYYSSNRLKKNVPTIVVIHNQEYYSDKNLEDRYNKLLSVSQPYIQHIQIETLREAQNDLNVLKGIIERSLAELSLKLSINDGINPVIAKVGKPFPNVTFSIPIIELVKNSKKDEKKIITGFASCALKDDCTINYNVIDRYSVIGSKLLNLYDLYNSSTEWKGTGKPVCFLWENGNIDVIYTIIGLQNSFQLPDYEKIFHHFAIEDKLGQKHKKHDYIEMFKAFFSDYNIPTSKAQKFLNSLENIDGEYFIPKNYKKLIKPTKGDVGITHLELFFWKTDPSNPYHNLPVVIPWRDKQGFPYFELPFKMGYTKTKLPFIDNKPCILYYTGCRTSANVIGAFNNVSRFRALVSDDTDDFSIWEYVYPLMDVDFLTQIDAFTVLPFPVKLLREYVIIKNKEVELDFAFD